MNHSLTNVSLQVYVVAILTFIIGYIPFSKIIKWEKHCFLNKENMVLILKIIFM